jgi:hypothetical protein
MESKTQNKSLFLFLALALSLLAQGCTTPRVGADGEILTREQREAIKIGKGMVQTSYDYSRPDSIAPDSKPVWVLPVINSGWKPAKVDQKTGDWIGGHYAATVVEDGKWATLEEAELSGKPYVLPGQTRPIIPVPLRNQSASSTGELNATTLEQKLARLDKLEREKRLSSPSDVSLNNQAAIPGLPPVRTTPTTRTQRESVPSSAPRQEDKPKINIPGLTSSASASQEEEKGERLPSILADPPQLPPPLPPPPSIETGEILPKSASSPSPLESPAKDPVLLSSPTPVPKYDSKTGEIILSYAPPGSTAKVQTPKGEVVVTYGEEGKTTVSLGKKKKTVTLTNPQDKIKIKIPN